MPFSIEDFAAAESPPILGRMRRVTMGPNQIAFIARAGDTDGAYALVEWLMAPPPAPGPPLHRHLAEDEAVLMLEGLLDCTLDGEARRLGPGDFVMVKKGRWHTLANPGPNHARYLIILSPPGFEGFWQELAELSRPGAPASDRVLALQAKYRMDAGGQARRLE